VKLSGNRWRRRLDDAHRLPRAAAEYEDPAAAEPRWLQDLEAIWKEPHANELERYLATGQALVGLLLAMSGRRLRRGGKIMLKLASQRLGIPQAELLRMRGFANRFRSVAELQARHAEIDSWSKLKKCFPHLDPWEMRRTWSGELTAKAKREALREGQQALQLAARRCWRQGTSLREQHAMDS
jgi:hypothetical protein